MCQLDQLPRCYSEQGLIPLANQHRRAEGGLALKRRVLPVVGVAQEQQRVFGAWTCVMCGTPTKQLLLLSGSRDTYFAITTVPTVPSWLAMSTAASLYVLTMRSVGSLHRLTLAPWMPTGKPAGCRSICVAMQPVNNQVLVVMAAPKQCFALGGGVEPIWFRRCNFFLI